MLFRFALLFFTYMIFNGLPAWAQHTTTARPSVWYKVQLKAGVSKIEASQLAQLAIRQLGDSTYIIHQSALQQIKNAASLTILTQKEADWKLLGVAAQPGQKSTANQRLQFYVQLLPACNTDSFLRHQNNRQVLWQATNTRGIVTAYCNATAVQLFINDAVVTNISVLPQHPTTELATPGYDLSANALGMVHRYFEGINGNGLEVSVKEDHFDTTDIDLRNRFRYSALASAAITNHANFMATIIAGAGNSVYYAKGAAPAALVSSASFQQVLPEANEYYAGRNIYVQNHSYGAGIDNAYGVNAVAFDKSANENNALLHVFSSGNSGTAASTNGAYAGIAGYANLTGNFKMSKNSISVGAVDSFGRVVALSSVGPAYDGRIKPEITAFQQNGTSEAAALVSGTCLLLQQYYQSVFGAVLPAALAKALLINSADDINAPGPDFKTGFGNLNAYKAMLAIQQQQLFSGNFTVPGTASFNITLPANARQLKVTLVWNDPAASTGAAKSLVNDLDLVVSNNGQNYLPWVLNSFAAADSLQLPAVRKTDSLNNTEQVSIQYPPPGTYTINIRSTRLTAPGQLFYIVYSIDSVNSFVWQWPAKKDVVLAGNTVALRWQTNRTDIADIQYSLEGGNWQTALPSANLAEGYVYWQLPDTIARARLRVNSTAGYVYSDTFTITALQAPTTAFVCGDSVRLVWKKLKGISRYRVLKLGTYNMEPLMDVSDSTVLLHKNLLDPPYVAVAPILGDTLLGVASYAFNYNQQGAGCYVNSFYTVLNGSAAQLNLLMGTLYNVVGISFQQMINAAYSTVATVPVSNQLQYQVLQQPLANGVNLFRVKLQLSDGRIIYSNPEAVLYAGPGEYVLLPVPVKKYSPLMLITTTPAGEVMYISDAAGRQLQQQRITGVQNFIDTSPLPAGTYFYRIVKDNKQVAAGRLVVL